MYFPHFGLGKMRENPSKTPKNPPNLGINSPPNRAGNLKNNPKIRKKKAGNKSNSRGDLSQTGCRNLTGWEGKKSWIFPAQAPFPAGISRAHPGWDFPPFLAFPNHFKIQNLPLWVLNLGFSSLFEGPRGGKGAKD